MANPPTAIATLIGLTAVPTVILRHELPDGSHHFDWMIASDPEGAGPLITFRLDQVLDELRPGESLRAERIADHRPHYLSYEGPVSGGRGKVWRMRSGTIHRGVADESTAKIEWNRDPSLSPQSSLSPPQRRFQVITLEVADFPVYTVFCVGISQ